MLEVDSQTVHHSAHALSKDDQLRNFAVPQFQHHHISQHITTSLSVHLATSHLTTSHFTSHITSPHLSQYISPHLTTSDQTTSPHHHITTSPHHHITTTTNAGRLFVAGAIFSEVGMMFGRHFSWQAQQLMLLECPFSWQAQHVVKKWEIAGTAGNVVIFQYNMRLQSAKK